MGSGAASAAFLLLILIYVVCAIISICLILAPLFIWKWTKATARAVEENNRLLRALLQRMGHAE